MATIVCLTCSECGIVFWISSDYAHLKVGKYLFCPNGHRALVPLAEERKVVAAAPPPAPWWRFS